jgi:hypothetical protein
MTLKPRLDAELQVLEAQATVLLSDGVGLVPVAVPDPPRKLRDPALAPVPLDLLQRAEVREVVQPEEDLADNPD